MAQPTNRAEFTSWCLRKLGSPVIEINVSDEQVSDRIDEALSFYWDYHFDGTEKTFLKHQVDANTIANEYITVPENIIGVVNLFDIGNSTSVNSLFNLQYQWSLNNIHDISSVGVTEYYMSMQHIQLLQEVLVGKQLLRYNRHVNRLYIDMNWAKINVGNYIIAECYGIVDPNTYVDVYKDRWLQNYATAKIKYQWGSNITKFEGMQLPGNVQFNGIKILDDAAAEIEKLEADVIKSFSLPVTDLIG